MNALAKNMKPQFEREYEQMVRDPLFKLYGGVRSEAGKAEYVAKRTAEVKRNLDRWNGVRS